MCLTLYEYFVFGKVLDQVSFSKLFTRIQFKKKKKAFYTGIINVGKTVQIPRFGSLSKEEQHVYGEEGKMSLRIQWQTLLWSVNPRLKFE